jgi:uncharacterized protein (DUF427 family)
VNRSRVEPGQESVWDYPRPPRLEETDRRMEVVFGGVTLAYMTHARQVLATSHPPVYYIPPEGIRMEHLAPSDATSFCEWKDRARSSDVSGGGRTEERAAWVYPQPTPRFREITGCVAFYPSKMDACWVDGEKVEAQPGTFMGLGSPPTSSHPSRVVPAPGACDPWTTSPASAKSTPGPGSKSPTPTRTP